MKPRKQECGPAEDGCPTLSPLRGAISPRQAESLTSLLTGVIPRAGPERDGDDEEQETLAFQFAADADRSREARRRCRRPLVCPNLVDSRRRIAGRAVGGRDHTGRSRAFSRPVTCRPGPSRLVSDQPGPPSQLSTEFGTSSGPDAVMVRAPRHDRDGHSGGIAHFLFRFVGPILFPESFTMRLPRLSEAVIRRSPSHSGATPGGVRPQICLFHECTSNADCTNIPGCPYCVANASGVLVCSAAQAPKS
jgi:hypothetical protein